MLLNAFIAMSFAELNSLMPKVNGGVGQYTLVGLGPIASIISNISAYVITMVFAIAVELTMCGMVLNEFIPAIPAPILSIIVILILFGLNLRGIDVFAKVQNTTVTLLIGSMVIMGIISFFKLGTGELISEAAQTLPTIQGPSNLMGLSAIAFWLFIGVEFVIPVATEMKNPKRDVLLSMILGLLLLFGTQALLGSGMTNYVTLEELASNPMPHMLFAEKVLGDFGKIWMGVITLLAGITTMNTVLPSTAKILQGMAEEKMVPKVFGRKNKRDVAYIGMILIAIADSLMILTGYTNSDSLITMVLAASCFWLTSYIITHACVLVLRKRYPDAPRNKKLTLLGIPQIIGIIGDIYMIWNISSEMTEKLAIYKVFLILFVILTAYAVIWVKAAMKTDLFKPISLEKMNSNADELFERNEKQRIELEKIAENVE
jgi:amino acid transporter